MLMNLLVGLIGFIIVIISSLALIFTSKVVSVRLATGKWPHEDEESWRIFEDMP